MKKVVSKAGLPGSKLIPALSCLMSFLALKLLGIERYAHAGDHAFDPGLGLFAKLNALPKCTAMSTYSYSLDDIHTINLQRAFIKHACKHALYDGKFVNLDFHTAPHFAPVITLSQSKKNHRTYLSPTEINGFTKFSFFKQFPFTKVVVTVSSFMNEENNAMMIAK